MVYCVPENVRDYLGVAATSDDELLTDLIARAEKAIETYCSRVFEGIVETRYFDVPSGEGDVWIDGVVRSGSNARTLFLDKDLISVTTLTNGNGDSIASTEYDLIPKNDIPKYGIRINQSSSVSWQGTSGGDTEDVISVVGVWGYSASPPDDIVHACIRLSAYYYRQKDAQVFDVTAIPDAGVMTIPQGIPADVKIILAPYKRRV